MGDNISGRSQPLAKQPALVIEAAGVCITMGPSQAYAQSPHLTDPRYGLRLVPAQANTRRQIRTFQRLRDEAKRCIRLARKVADTHGDIERLALHRRIEPVLDDQPCRKPHRRVSCKEAGEQARLARAEASCCQQNERQKQFIGGQRATEAQRIGTAQQGQASEEHVPPPCDSLICRADSWSMTRHIIEAKSLTDAKTIFSEIRVQTRPPA